MSERLPRVNVAEVIRVIEKCGFSISRQSGKHKIYKNREGRRITLTHHLSKTIHPKVLKSILQDANLTIEKFKELIR